MVDPDPWVDPVDGATLLDELAAWLRDYVYFPQAAADAVALWIAATWFVEQLDFAVVLALVSATKRCGKTLLLELLKPVVRRGYRTSGPGVTPAVLFRLNDAYHPTLLIDEAEKLEGRHADKTLVGMLNDGYRRGANVLRCQERTLEVRGFDAFGFKALAAIGSLWDTILDRAIVIRLERKPRNATVRRFSSRDLEREANDKARRLARWAADNLEAVGEASLESPQPQWLHDRACDNWSGLLAVAAVAGGHWPGRALAAARVLSADAEERDPTELLVIDIGRLWKLQGWGRAGIASGELVDRLNELEDSPWGEHGGGRGLSTHSLARMLKPLGVPPRQNRTSDGRVLRGYWWSDLQPVFQRYLPPELVPPVQVVQEAPGRVSPESAVPLVPDVPVRAEGSLPERSVPQSPEKRVRLPPHIARPSRAEVAGREAP